MTNEITNEELARLKSLAEAAMPGPWVTAQTYADNGTYTGLDIYSADGTALIAEEQHPGDNDARFIAAANPATILALIAKVESLAADAERYRLLKSLGFEYGKPRHYGVEPIFRIEFSPKNYGRNDGEDKIDEAIDAMAKEKA